VKGRLRMAAEDIILIESASSGIGRRDFKEHYKYPPFGLLCLSSFLKLHGYRVYIIDLMLEDHSVNRFRERLASLTESPLAVGVSVYTDCAPEAVEIAGIVKQVFPTTSVIAGGPHATFRAEELLSHRQIDFVVRREGEATLVELLEYIKYPTAYPADEVLSISYRGKDGTVTNPERPFVRQLDQLPFPDYEAIESLKRIYRKRFLIVSSRGCPGECVFCASRAMSGNHYRFHSAEWLFSLLFEYRARYSFPLMVVMDDTFTVNRRRARYFCRYLDEHWSDSAKLRWTCKSRADGVDDEMCALISQAGCRSMHVGVESADQDVLDSIAKNVTLERVLEALLIARRHGISADCSFIIGHPADTLETIEKTLILARVIRDLNIGHSAIGVATPFPGTRLFEDASELEVDIAVKSWRKYNLSTPIYSTPRFSLNDLRKAALSFDDRSKTWEDPIGLTGSNHCTFLKKIHQFVDAVREIEAERVTSAGGV
jgi:radical SAM superfamily enzyme YgiQ (UPF0313 family)